MCTYGQMNYYTNMYIYVYGPLIYGAYVWAAMYGPYVMAVIFGFSIFASFGLKRA